jgi:hypothetical protein
MTISTTPLVFDGLDIKSLYEVAALVKKYNKHYRKQDIDSIASYLNGIAWTYGRKNISYVAVSGVVFTFFDGVAGRVVKLSIDTIILPKPKARVSNKKAA